jgi:hypothetical protein
VSAFFAFKMGNGQLSPRVSISLSKFMGLFLIRAAAFQ